MNVDTLEKILLTGENRSCDFKRELSLSTNEEKIEFIKDIISIANSANHTGYLIIGVEDNGKIVGCEPPKEEKIQQLVSTHIHPLVNISYYIITYESKDVIVLEVGTNAKPYKVNTAKFGMEKNSVFVRHGSVVEKASPEEIIEMYKESSAIPSPQIEFNRLVDVHKNSLSNLVVDNNNNRLVGVVALEYILKELYKELKKVIRYTIRVYICESNIEKIDPLIIENLFQAKMGLYRLQESVISGKYEEDKTIFITQMKNMNFNERWEYLKTFLGSTDNKNEHVIKMLDYMSGRNFFNFTIEHRFQDYGTAFQSIINKYGVSFEPHLNSITQMINFISDNEHFSDRYILSLSKQEKVLIFYYCMSETILCNTLINIVKTSIISDVLDENQYWSRDYMIDAGNMKIMKSDMEKRVELCESGMGLVL